MTALTIATLFPLDTVAAGDEANGPALVRRARQRGISATHTTINRPEAMTAARIYLLGGDGLAGVSDLVGHLRATSVRRRGAIRRAIVVAVDAGLAAVGRSWTQRDGEVHDGLGLVGCTALGTPPSAESVMTRPAPGRGLPEMIGWHSQAASRWHATPASTISPRSSPATRVPRPHDGVVTPVVIGTQLHGPALALNPELADLVLAQALGVSGWDPLPIPSVQTARARRIAELTSQPPRATSRTAAPGLGSAEADPERWATADLHHRRTMRDKTAGCTGRSPRALHSAPCRIRSTIWLMPPQPTGPCPGWP